MLGETVPKPTFYPAPGFRDCGYFKGFGTLYYVGYNGYCWTSTLPARNTGAHYLSFNSGGNNPNTFDYRGYGLPLRCLQE